MRRMIIVAMASMLAMPVLAEECKPVESFKVGRINYRARPLQQALSHILRGTPYQGSVENKPQAMVRARRLNGPLSKTLDLLAAQTGSSWQQEGCKVRFADKSGKLPSATPVTVAPKVAAVSAQDTPKAVAATWTLRANTPIHLQFAEWAQRAGWHFEWKLEKSWIVPATAQFTGTFDEALSLAVEGLYAQGKPVRLIIWEGNRFAEIVDVDAK